jgi:SAM-dependent methyltransferase
MKTASLRATILGLRDRPLNPVLVSLPTGANVVDIGCTGFDLVQRARWMGRSDLIHSGVDYMPLSAPVGFDFRKVDLDREAVPFPDDSFDLVVASHIIEHLRDPTKFCAELVRIAKPGGLVYIEAPSERSLWLPGMPFEHDKFCSLSFYDDPTHQLRPWSPQAFHRIFCYLQCYPIRSGYHYSWIIRFLLPLMLPGALLLRNARLLEFTIWRAIGWASYAVIKKPTSVKGSPEFRYYYSSK